ncbi:MAG: PDZ domain-containing protein [Gemmataceae bacterium]|nr:PDZ domain-containing protein [Gemmataceae bacterium]
MKRIFAALAVLGLWLVALDVALAQQTKSPQMVQLFQGVVAKPGESTVRVLVADKEVALGTIVTADGWILTKHSELRAGQITCKFSSGLEVHAELFGFDVPHDLAMLKIAVGGLIPVVWTDSNSSKIGHWVASPGTSKDPVAIGVISVAAREIKVGKKFTSMGPGIAYLGVTFEPFFAGVKVEEVLPKAPGQEAGLKAGDQILAYNGKPVDSVDEFRAVFSNSKPGDEIKLKIFRAGKEQEITVKLIQNPTAKGGASRSDTQNKMGSKLSDRRTGFPIILQHDSVLKPNDCGGPLVNLDGQVLGINIARAGRVESYAIPSEAVRPLLEKLKTKKLDKKTP